MEAYCERLRAPPPGEEVWGGFAEIVALSKVYKLEVRILEEGAPDQVIGGGEGRPGEPLYLVYDSAKGHYNLAV